ncbi:MAG TPA: hypothetical protein VHF51_18530 [Solirubrobacteraceae bacterium]|nr:hypothetical protein [Solirubrobacteraceae bacterium]
MLRQLRSRLTYANVMASVAVFLSLSGGAYALTIPRNSVGTRQLREKAVTRAKLATGAVASTQVRDGTLRAKDFRRSDLPRGRTGERGPRGATGLRGSTGARGATGPRGESALDPVPTGRTIRGVVGANLHAFSNDPAIDYGVDAVLPIPAPSNLTDAQVSVDVAGAVGGPTTADGNPGCTGTPAAPSAPAGRVCIYVAAAANAVTLQGLSAAGAAGSPYGFKLIWNSANAGDTFVDATWAYTAP